MGPHIAYMADAFPPKYELTTRLCTIHSGRYRWVITGNGKPVQTSSSSFETPAMAHTDGDVTLEKLIRSSMIGQRAQRFRRAKKTKVSDCRRDRREAVLLFGQVIS